MELHVLSALRGKTVRVDRIRSAMLFLKKEMGTEHPLADVDTDEVDVSVEFFGQFVNASRGQATFECVPVRFLGACRRGHAQEWPWISGAHLGKPMCAAASLRLEEVASGDFAEVRVVCACGASQSLATAAARRVEMHCDGHRRGSVPRAARSATRC